jgi:hypothetical protein
VDLESLYNIVRTLNSDAATDRVAAEAERIATALHLPPHEHAAFVRSVVVRDAIDAQRS